MKGASHSEVVRPICRPDGGDDDDDDDVSNP